MIANHGFLAVFRRAVLEICRENQPLATECRHHREFKQLDTALLSLATREAKRFGLELKIECLGRHLPGIMSDVVQRAYAEACDTLGLTHVSLPSGAGHDGQSLADLCPTGMIFVPSVDGASHSPREFTEWDDCVNGANVLLHAAMNLASAL